MQGHLAHSPLEIAVIVGLFSGLASIGGVQLAGQETAAALAAIARDRGWPCTFLSLNDASSEQEGRMGDMRFRYAGFARAKARFAFKALQFARGKPKVIFAGHPNLAPISMMMKAVSKDTRTIVGAHGVEVWQPLPVIRRRMLRHANIVVAPSADTARRLETAQGVSARRICRLPWPLDPEFAAFARNTNQLPRPDKFPEGRVVLSVGRWDAAERYKGADLLIRAIAKLSREFQELQLLLLGSGDDSPRLQQLAQTLNVGEKVHFFTEFSREYLAACYAAAEIFALPSTGEGFGLVFLEAMAFGKPVIGTNLGGIPDVVEDGREGLLVEPSVAALSCALRKLLCDRAFCCELGARGKQRVEREFTFEKFQQRLQEIVGSVL